MQRETEVDREFWVADICLRRALTDLVTTSMIFANMDSTFIGTGARAIVLTFAFGEVDTPSGE